MEFPLSLVEFIAATTIVAIGSALQCSVGYGLGLVVIPILVLIDPAYIPGAVILTAFTMSTMIIIREKRSVNFRGLQWAIIGRILGALVAAWLLTLITQDTLILISGFLVLIAVVITAKGFSIPTTRVNLGIAGLVSGIMGTLAAIGGPPIALVYQNESGARIRTSLSGFFIAGGVISIITLSLAGRFGIHEVMLGLTLLPGTLIGFLGSSRVLPWLDGKYTKQAVLLVATVSALVVIVDQIL